MVGEESILPKKATGEVGERVRETLQREKQERERLRKTGVTWADDPQRPSLFVAIVYATIRYADLPAASQVATRKNATVPWSVQMFQGSIRLSIVDADGNNSE